MNQIEAAAKGIAQKVCTFFSREQAANIITRHLFAPVAPSEVKLGKWYWVVMPGHEMACREPWSREGVMMFGSYEAIQCEVKGPIPMPPDLP